MPTEIDNRLQAEQNKMTEIEIKAITMGVVSWICFFCAAILVGVFVANPAIVANAHKKWRFSQGHIISQSMVKTERFGNSSTTQVHRNFYAYVSYRNWQGNTAVNHIMVESKPRIGEEVNVYVRSNDVTVIPANLWCNYYAIPLRPQQWGPLAGFFVGLFGGWIPFVIFAAAFEWLLKLKMRNQSLAYVVSMPRRGVRRLRDSVRLHREFRRRRKHMKLTAAYKAVRKFQALLERMTPPKGIPVPKVLIDAKIKANALAEDVAKRDSVDAKYITAQIEAIHAEVKDDLEARAGADEELSRAEDTA
jgi:hypothetical protein